MNKILNTFVREKPLKLILLLLSTQSEIYVSNIAKLIDCTYSHVAKILSIMEQHGLIMFEKKGRAKLIKLTPKGRDVALIFNKLKIFFEQEIN